MALREGKIKDRENETGITKEKKRASNKKKIWRKKKVPQKETRKVKNK